MLFSTKVPRSVASVALLRKLPQFYTNLKNVPFAMNEKNGIGESKSKQSRSQEESAPELPVGRAYAVRANINYNHLQLHRLIESTVN